MGFFDHAAKIGLASFVGIRQVNQFVGMVIHLVAALGADHFSGCHFVFPSEVRVSWLVLSAYLTTKVTGVAQKFLPPRRKGAKSSDPGCNFLLLNLIGNS
jgi:hypothetical protein